MERKDRQEPAVTISLSPSLSGNIALFSAISKRTAQEIVEEAVARYLVSEGLDPHRMPKLQFP